VITDELSVCHGTPPPREMRSWPVRSPDLSACGYFLWGCLKINLSIFKPRTIEKLKQRIKEEIAEIPEQTTRWMTGSLRERSGQCLRN
ncbi:hypothetical protein Cfor_02817, partial [Coptotermes formosanus]